MNGNLRFDYMNKNVKPNEDFGEYANGNYEKINPIPDAYGSWGMFMMLRDSVLDDLKVICEENGSDTENGTEYGKKIGNFWNAAMDLESIESSGLIPLMETLLKISKVDAVDGFVKVLGELHAVGISGLYEAEVIPDLKDSTVERLMVGQGGLGMPDRDYYLEDSKKPMLEEYRGHIEKMFNMVNGKCDTIGKNAGDIANTIVALETKLAEKSKSRTDMRDLASLYNPQTQQDIEKHDWKWNEYYQALGFTLSDAPYVINATPLYFDFLATEIKLENIEDWKLYLQWHVIHSMAAYLSDDFVQQNFKLAKVLSGAKELEPRWKRVISTLNAKAGELLGQVYCDRKFSSHSKEKCLEMIEQLRIALQEMIQNLEWMGDATKQKALEKLAGMGVKVGFPDEWINYSGLSFKSDSYVQNVIRAQAFEHLRNMQRVNKPVDPLRWEMAPQVVNAYYHPIRNEIVFPAAVLQAPAFDASRDDALNFGGIGAVIGHEMTHGFDDQGRLFDVSGNMVEWWSPEDNEKFKALASTVVSQFGQYESHGKKVNGDLTQGENIADIGGVKIAYLGLQKQMKKNGRPQDQDGYTPEQRFFLSFAQLWASSVREEQAHKLLAIDPHSPSQLRAYAPLKNLPEFYKTFNVQPGDPMHLPEQDRVTIW